MHLGGKALRQKICVIGAGYVGLSLSCLLSTNNDVNILEINDERVRQINCRVNPIVDSGISEYFKNKKLSIFATNNPAVALKSAQIVIIATPTNYDETRNSFDVRSVDESIIKALKYASNCQIFIKSTLPLGYIEQTAHRLNINNLHFSAEFLREGKALYDNLHPSRIVVGTHNYDAGMEFARLLLKASECSDVPIFITSPTEAESIKLFSNTYLAMRVAFFNELDTYAEVMGLNSAEIIKGVCSDPRIGHFYNNPSFGYGGYCLPKDTKQLLASYKDVPNRLIGGIVESNEVRKDFIAKEINDKGSQVIGIYRLTMKAGSDNFRSAAIQGIIARLVSKKRELIIYEPLLQSDSYMGVRVEKDLEKFKEECGIIVANRMDSGLDDVKNKVYTRDIFHQS